MNISDSQIQMTLDLDTQLTERFRSAKEAMAAGVYRRGLKRCAADLDVAPLTSCSSLLTISTPTRTRPSTSRCRWHFRTQSRQES